MPTLPSRPDLDQLRRRARELQRRANAGVTEAHDLLRRYVEVPPGAPVSLHLAQLALARDHGFRSWPRMVEQIRTVHRYSRNPLLGIDDAADDPVTDFLRHAVLLYGPPDGPDRWRRARRLASDHPDLATRSVAAAAALGDLPALQRHLLHDPGSARRPTGPLRWAPLLYLTYSRVNDDQPADVLVEIARAMLDAGADPDEGFLWQGAPTPFTALTGVFGGGEQGDRAEPEHRHAHALAEVLLAGGADPNDGQVLYNRMFTPTNGHLELLLAHGLGRGDGGPWRRRLPDLVDAPSDVLRPQLAWAVIHGFDDRVRLLAEAGVDLVVPLDSGPLLSSGLTPRQLALRCGRVETADLLVSLGVPVGIDAASALTGALLAADAEAVGAAAADTLAAVRREQPALVLRAAVTGRVAAVRLVAACGFDVNAYGRADIPRDEPWETALHHAAGGGDVEVVRALLELGADLTLRDSRFSATPADWARYFDRHDVAQLIEGFTPPGPAEPNG